MAPWRSRTGRWEDLVQAYVDDMLPPRQRLEVEEYLAIHPDEARRVADFRNQNRGFHELYDHYLLEPLPPRAQFLEQRILGKMARQRTFGTVTRIAATAVIAVLVMGGSWYGAQYYFAASGPQIDFLAFTGNSAKAPGPTAQGRREDVRSANIASREQDVQSASIASKEASGNRSKAAESGAPDLSDFGLRLTSSREVSQSTGAEAAQLVYESEGGQQVMLYYSPTKDNGTQKITLTEQGPISILVWNRGGRSFSLIGDVNRDTMLAIGAAVNTKWVKSPAPRQGTGKKAPPPDAPRNSEDRTQRNDSGTETSPSAETFQPAVSQEKVPAEQ